MSPWIAHFLCSEEGRTYSCKAPRHWGHVPGHPSPPSRKSSLTTAQGESHRQILALSDALLKLQQTMLNSNEIGTAFMRYCYATASLVPSHEGNGWGGIRTPGAFRHTRFPGVHNQPLCHPSKQDCPTGGRIDREVQRPMICISVVAVKEKKS